MNSSLLALQGGTPARSTFLPYARHAITSTDLKAVEQTLCSSFLTQGPMVQKFEEAICEYIGAKYAVAFSSGTAALHGAAHAVRLEKGKNALTSPLTFAASANCAVYQQAEVRFVDIHPDILTINEALIEPAMDQDTRAIIAVDYAGHPCAYDPLQSLARLKNVALISDACHSLGATYKGRKVGTLADITTFSFHPAKLITTGEGGMAVTDNRDYYESMKIFRTHGIEKHPEKIMGDMGGWYYEMRTLGNNYRLSDIQCALGLSQLARIDSFLRRRREIAARYSENLKKFPSLALPPVREGSESAWHIYPLRFRMSHFSVDRKTIFQAFHAENIGVQVHYIPVYRHPYYRKLMNIDPQQYSVTENAYAELISLPLFPSMTDDDVQTVLTACEKIVHAFAS